jgi:P-type Ca2+ transporter type 2C
VPEEPSLKTDGEAVPVEADTRPAYQSSTDDVLKTLGVAMHSGLAEDDARSRLSRHGANELTAEPPVPGWRKFTAQFRDVLVILLLIATAISAILWLLERDAALPYEAIAILAVVLRSRADR